MEKAFEKQIKTIEDQGEKQIKAIKIKEKLKQSKNMLIMIKIVDWFQNEKKAFYKFADKRLEEITNLD